MEDLTQEWRKRIEEAIADGDKTHLQIVLDQVFSEVEGAIRNSESDDWDY